MRYSAGMPMREGYVEIAKGVSLPMQALREPPYINWRHIDGPLMHWAGHMDWLTWLEALSVLFRISTPQQVANKRWPHLAALFQPASLRG